MNVSGSKVKTLFGTPENAYLDNANKTDITGIDTGGKDWGAVGGGLMSYMSRVSYNYKDRYMADFVIPCRWFFQLCQRSPLGYLPFSFFRLELHRREFHEEYSRYQLW
jgi:hypothetical protein